MRLSHGHDLAALRTDTPIDICSIKPRSFRTSSALPFSKYVCDSARMRVMRSGNTQDFQRIRVAQEAMIETIMFSLSEMQRSQSQIASPQHATEQ